MRERLIEKHLTSKCKAHGILCYKFVSPGQRNVPDRILIKGGKVVFLELKATGKKPSEAQWREITRIQEAGGMALTADSTTHIDWIIQTVWP